MTENNTNAKCGGDKQRALWYVMVFSVVVNSRTSRKKQQQQQQLGFIFLQLLKLLPKRSCDDFLNSHRSLHPSFLIAGNWNWTASNPDLQVAVTHACHVYRQHSLGPLLRKNGMHRTRSNGMCVLTFYRVDLRNAPEPKINNRVLTFDQKPVIPPHSLTVIGYYWYFIFINWSFQLNVYWNSAVDGNWGHWSYWSGCSVTCLQGQRTRSRQCDNPTPLHGGKTCEGASTETGVCVMKKCFLGKCKTFFLMWTD